MQDDAPPFSDAQDLPDAGPVWDRKRFPFVSLASAVAAVLGCAILAVALSVATGGIGVPPTWIVGGALAAAGLALVWVGVVGYDLGRRHSRLALTFEGFVAEVEEALDRMDAERDAGGQTIAGSDAIPAREDALKPVPVLVVSKPGTPMTTADWARVPEVVSPTIGGDKARANAPTTQKPVERP